MTRTSTVNLTLTIETPAGIPNDLTANVIAEQAANRIQTSLAQCHVRATVTGKVTSAFVVRTEVSD